MMDYSTKPVEPHPLGEVGDLIVVPAVPPVPGDDLLLLRVALQHAQLPPPLVDVRHRRRWLRLEFGEAENEKEEERKNFCREQQR